MVLRELLDRTAPDEVDPAVTHMRDGEFAPVQQRCHNGGTHARPADLPVSGFIDGAVRQLDCVRKRFGVKRRPFDGKLANRRGGGRVLAEVSQQDVNRQLAGDLAGSLSAHAVAKHEDAVARVVPEVVFVVGTNTADVGFSGNFNCKRHADFRQIRDGQCPNRRSFRLLSRLYPASVDVRYCWKRCGSEEEWPDSTQKNPQIAIRDLPAYMDHAARGLDKPLLSNMMASFLLVDH